MRKWVRRAVFFAPAILLAVLGVNTIMEYGLERVQPFLMLLTLFAVCLSAFLLDREVFWGGIFGAVAIGVPNIVSSFSNGLAGPIQAGIGVTFIVFYAICGLYVYLSKKHGEAEEAEVIQ